MALLEEGQDIHGTYIVERFLGEGAFAEVYRVRHRFLGRQAMKVFKRGDDRCWVERYGRAGNKSSQEATPPLMTEA